MDKLLIAITTLQLMLLISLSNAIILTKHITNQLDEFYETAPLLGGNLPSEYDIVYPHVTNSKGILNSYQLDMPQGKTSLLRSRHNIVKQKQRSKKLFISINLKDDKLLMVLKPNRKFYAKNPQVEKVTADGKKKLEFVIRNCYYVGHLKNQLQSTVALSTCKGLTGLIRTKSADYFIEPWKAGGIKNVSEAQPHVIYKVDSMDQTFTWRNISIIDDYDTSTLLKTRLKRNMKPQTNEDDVDDDDDDAVPMVNASSKIYLETVIAADHSVVKFHGQKHTIQYIMTLMNIVSTIYDDPSLDGNIDVVVVKILLVDNTKHNITIVKRNTRASLDNVCKWANNMHRENPNKTYDIAIFLTRHDIGGPAGYAPLASICNSERSCTVNKDEGLTSAFILAHEIAHVLGLSHDGDEFQHNNCSDDGVKGSVMAPTVQSNFNRYYWSDCSKVQFHKKRKFWNCLLNKPNSTSMLSIVTKPENKYSLDEQCRQEFGDGYKHCKSFPISDPCTNLWCGHSDDHDVCKTKKGPPLDGTECGRDKWCVSGFCMKKRKNLKHSIRRNPRHGGWSEWSPLGHCSRSCGIGVQFRARKCNKPEPAFGGRHCKGSTEEFQLCNVQLCPEIRDFRAEQCSTINRKIKLNSTHEKLPWKPIAGGEYQTCQLTCTSKKSKEVLNTGENVVDGTPCSYDGTRDICVQGQCQPVGCDGIMRSSLHADQCGVCGGNGSFCKNYEKIYAKTPKRRFVRIIVIPKRARLIEITKTMGAPNFLILQSRKQREFFLNGPRNRTESCFVALGAKFDYTERNGTELLTATGPLLDELTVLVSVKRFKTAVRVISKYTIPKNKSLDSIMGSEDPFEWTIRGWDTCSKACGGGIHSVKITCVDTRIKKFVSKRHCSLLDKPKTRQRICNNFNCSYRWQTESWEFCSHTCGTKGIQKRQVHCVLANSTLVKVKPNLCMSKKPLQEQPCNIYPCPASWDIGPWSACSVTCGKGLRYRNVTCLPPENDVIYDCGEKPSENDVCDVGSCKQDAEVCHRDTSEVCKMKVLYRYCIKSDFFNYCCVSCANYMKNNK